MKIDGKFDELSEALVDNLIFDIQNPDREIVSEYELGTFIDDSGGGMLNSIEIGSIFLGVNSFYNDEEEKIVTVYVYLPDRRVHNDTDNHTEMIEDEPNALFEESLELNRVSTELLTLLDTLVSSVSIDDSTFNYVENDFVDCSKPSNSAYYALKFPYSDIEKIEI